MFKKDRLEYNNRPMSRGLFKDVSPSEYNIMYLEKGAETDLPVLEDLYYIHTESDPTEYTFAKEVFGSWEFWERLSSSNDIKEVVEKWRKENMIRFKSNVVKSIAKEGQSGRSKFAALKFLYSENFLPATAKEVKEIKNEVKTRVSKDIKGDAERLGLKIV